MQEQLAQQLAARGVKVVSPQSVSINPDVDLEKIEGPGTVLYPGASLRGSKLRIMPGCHIGPEGPVVVNDCVLGPEVTLSAGYFAGSVFLDKASMGLGAHIRPGCLLEEEANGAHTVGLKQTILLPFVTLGSLINFCDILMAGGTSRRDHSEVGSSFIHFNFTPQGARGDKATPSLIGDIPRGVMLRSSRIFLGGQAGIVGPVSMDYGTVLAAGFVYRQDHGPDELVVGEPLTPAVLAFNPTRLTRMKARVERNLRYLGNIIALWHWYEQVRLPLAKGNEARSVLYSAAQKIVDSVVKERVKQLARLVGYFEASIVELEKQGEKRAREIRDQRALLTAWPQIEADLAAYGELRGDETQLASLHKGLDASEAEDYITTIQALSDPAVAAGSSWMDGLVNHTLAALTRHMP
ncbi:MAG: UDP-N-acetylglucosamine pyrophosphorylase, partial [Deltaproteobacteria bacterium]|nr:UDP-N-acetylglucosamine pyrophosphorylase [Deltaproteobacteria bacterium]